MSLINEVKERGVSYYIFVYNIVKEATFVHSAWDTFMRELLGWLQSERNLSGATL